MCPGVEMARISADIGLPAFILEVDLRLIERRVKQVVGVMLHARSRGRANAQPIQPQRIAASDPVLRVERQKLGQSLLLSAIEHVALKFRDDEGEASNLGREVAQLDPAKVGERDFACGGPASPRRRLISASIARISL